MALRHTATGRQLVQSPYEGCFVAGGGWRMCGGRWAVLEAGGYQLAARKKQCQAVFMSTQFERM